MFDYVVSYDLHNARNYQPLWQKLEQLGAVKLLESVWLLKTAFNSIGLRDTLAAVIDGDDSLAVIELKPGSAWGGIRARDEGVQWLRNNLLR